jgi:YHS domain-containing protein
MASHADHRPAHTSQVVKDPVCGMDVDSTQTAFASEHQGETFSFCSGHCKDRFDADPRTFLHARTGHADAEPVHAGHADLPSATAAEVATAADVSEASEWTCPMHPEIRRSAPGSCPICGMALEPVTVTADSGPSPELADMTRRFWVAVALSVPVFLLGMGGDLIPAIHDVISPTASGWIQLVLATPVVVWAGWPFFERNCRCWRAHRYGSCAMAHRHRAISWASASWGRTSRAASWDK